MRFDRQRESALTQMDVLHVISGLGPGGAEHMLCRLVAATPHVSHRVLSLSGRGILSAALESSGAEIIDRGSGAKGVRGLARAMAGNSPDIIQGWMYHGNLTATLLKIRFPSASLIWGIRQSISLKQFTKPTTRILIGAQAIISKLPDVIVYNSLEAALGHEAGGFSSVRRELVANGFDVEIFAPDAAVRRTVRSDLGIADDEVVVGLVARWDPWKNHPGFLRVATLLSEEYPECRFIMLGKGIDWSNVELVSLIGDSLRERVILLGDRRDVQAINNAFDVACNVSHGEGFPNAVGEAMACGRMCVVTPVGATESLIGDCGVVAASTSDSDILDALRMAVALSPAEREEAGSRARARIEKHYAIEAVAQEYLKLYSRLRPTKAS